MENRYTLTWQYDETGNEGSVKVMSFDAYEEAVAFMEKAAKAGVIRDRLTSTEVKFWATPTFTGKLARSLRH